jgi:putative flippase GtrA
MPWKGTIARFVLVGFIGFCVDALVLEMLLEIGLDSPIAQLYAACVAILVTFVLNRTYTLSPTPRRQSYDCSLRILAFNAPGLVLTMSHTHCF